MAIQPTGTRETLGPPTCVACQKVGGPSAIPGVRCALLPLVIRHILLVTRHSSLTTRRSPHATHHTPLATRHSLANLPDNRGRARDFLAGKRLAAAAQVLGQEGLGAGVEVDPILGDGRTRGPRRGKARSSPGPHSSRSRRRSARPRACLTRGSLAPCTDQQGTCGSFVGLEFSGALKPALPWGRLTIADPDVEDMMLRIGFPVRRDGADQRLQVRRPTMSTAQAKISGVNVTPASAA